MTYITIYHMFYGTCGCIARSALPVDMKNAVHESLIPWLPRYGHCPHTKVQGQGKFRQTFYVRDSQSCVTSLMEEIIFIHNRISPFFLGGGGLGGGGSLEVGDLGWIKVDIWGGLISFFEGAGKVLLVWLGVNQVVNRCEPDWEHMHYWHFHLAWQLH